jgi:PqqD family protein of HPr-rel-A system
LRWRLNTAYDIQIWRCGDEAVVYHPGSGDTHHLSLVAVLVLEAVTSAPRTTDELTQVIASAVDGGVADELVDTVARTLSDIERLGLIESQQ